MWKHGYRMFRRSSTMFRILGAAFACKVFLSFRRSKRRAGEALFCKFKGPRGIASVGIYRQTGRVCTMFWACCLEGLVYPLAIYRAFYRRNDSARVVLRGMSYRYSHTMVIFAPVLHRKGRKMCLSPYFLAFDYLKIVDR